jgi:hypothetical protein
LELYFQKIYDEKRQIYESHTAAVVGGNLSQLPHEKSAVASATNPFHDDAHMKNEDSEILNSHYSSLDQFTYEIMAKVPNHPFAEFEFPQRTILRLVNNDRIALDALKFENGITLENDLDYRRSYYPLQLYREDDMKSFVLSDDVIFQPMVSTSSSSSSSSFQYLYEKHSENLFENPSQNSNINWLNELDLISLLPRVPTEDTVHLQKKLLQILDPFLLQQIISLLIPANLSTFSSDGNNVPEARKAELNQKADSPLKDRSSGMKNSPSQATLSSTLSSNHGSQEEEEEYDDIFMDVASEEGDSSSDKEYNEEEIEAWNEKTEAIRKGKRDSGQDMDDLHLSNISDSAFYDSSFLNTSAAAEDQNSNNHGDNDEIDPLLKIARTANLSQSQEEQPNEIDSKFLPVDDDEEKQKTEINSSSSPTAACSSKNSFVPNFLRSILLSDSYQTFLFQLFYLFLQFQEQLSFFYLNQMEVYQDLLRSLSSASNENPQNLLFSDKYLHKKQLQNYLQRYRQLHQQQDGDDDANNNNQGPTLFNQLFFHGFKAKVENPDDDEDGGYGKCYVQTIFIFFYFLFYFFFVARIRPLQTTKTTKTHNTLVQQRDRDNDRLLSLENTPEVLEAREKFLYEISNTVFQIFEHYINSRSHYLNHLEYPLVTANASLYDEMNSTQELMLYQLLLLSENYVQLVKYFIYFHKSFSLLYFVIRLSNSANVMMHRNSMGTFSSNAKEDIVDYYYYQKGKGKSMKNTDLQLITLNSSSSAVVGVDKKNIDSSAEHKLNRSLNPFDEEEEEDEVEDNNGIKDVPDNKKDNSGLVDEDSQNDDEEDEEDDDVEIFKICNVQYFKDRNRPNSLKPSSKSTTASVGGYDRDRMSMSSVTGSKSLARSQDENRSYNRTNRYSFDKRLPEREEEVPEQDDFNDLNHIRMNEAIHIFYLAMKYFIMKLYYCPVEPMVTFSKDEHEKKAKEKKRILLDCVIELVLSRPMSVSNDQVHQFLQEMKGEYEGQFATAIEELLQELLQSKTLTTVAEK